MKLKLWSWNVNGLRAVLKKDFIKTIKESGADIIGLQETKLQNHQIPEEIQELDEYHLYWSHAERKGYSGTALLSQIKPLHFEDTFGVEEFDNEGRINIAEYEDFIFFNIYFPNGQSGDARLEYKLRFYDKALEIMQEKRKTGKMVLVAGDYNTAHKAIDLANPKANEKTSGFLPIERAWIDKIVELGWVDTFRDFDLSPEQYSWWSYRTNARPRNVGWRIDYFFVDKEHRNQIIDAGIRQDVMGSDHCPVFVELSLP
ncbi:MAG: exodeoxyribonuclease III [Candidatus Cloacimonetes bacterium]|jgi:exodeoxyribonuclease-3|nr:exodeoxyribonuclease III [Candidatus Cloacimonadota bacterium]MDD2422668.1 exodeoxyribonuclease III [Candidatus Cloacimonadota bacterium]MDD3562545.1 exodeoxyribonuclease III [Candidatus Cloacimonadota bacterium]MDD4276412.1 exodeoxyribonuclease III [Candidatus Cloacimonadota bacterium]MDY0325450.1 exodeoxyribonuclease III [Candidatus Cloacimonadaceae bacterium]